MEPTQEEIRAHLKRIENSLTFNRSSSGLDILRYLIDKRLENAPGDAFQAKEIGAAVFGKRFDPTSNIVRVTIGRLKTALLDYYETEGKNDPVRIDIQRVLYVPKFRYAVEPQPIQAETPKTVEPTQPIIIKSKPQKPPVVNVNVPPQPPPVINVNVPQEPPVIHLNVEPQSINLTIKHEYPLAPHAPTPAIQEPQNLYYGEWRSFVTCPRCDGHSIEDPIDGAKGLFDGLLSASRAPANRLLKYRDCYRCKFCNTMWHYKPL